MEKWQVLPLVGVILAIFLNYPAPKLSTEMKEWTKSGRYFTHKEYRIFYKETIGVGDNTVICLHGFPTSSYDWYKVWPQLLNNFDKVIALDLIGFGFSDKPNPHDYSIKEQADIVEDLLFHLDVTEVHLLAHDYGDTVAQELLYRFDNSQFVVHQKLKVKSVCLLNGGILPETNFPMLSQQVLLRPLIGPMLCYIMNYLSFKKGLGSVFGENTQPSRAEMSDFWAAIRWNNGHQIASRLLQYIPERHANRDRWVGVLQTTKVPVHVIYGPADPVNPPVFLDRYRELVPHAVITVLNSHISHYPQLEDPTSVMTAYLGFLESNKLI